MYKKFLSWPFLLLFAALLLAVLIPIVRTAYFGVAHANGNGNMVPQIQVVGSVATGQPFQLQVQGFQPAEQVQVSWNGNGGQFLGMLNTDAKGTVINCSSTGSCITAPPVPAGAYMLTAIGSTSRLQANTSVNAIISLTVAPQNVGPGSTIQVAGTGFRAGENLGVYFQDMLANGLSTVNADNNGSFTQVLTLPKTYNPQMSYYVYVKNAQNVQLAKSLFSFAGVSITSSVAKATSGTKITISGKGFLANETVSLDWGYQSFWWAHNSKVTADGYGNFAATIAAPSVFNTINATLEAIGSGSNLKASSTIMVMRTIRSGSLLQNTGLWPGWGILH